MLASEIVQCAVSDWRMLIKAKAWKDERRRRAKLETTQKVNFDEIRIFLKSDWCTLLMNNFTMRPEHVLHILEKELSDAIEADKLRKKEAKIL